MTKAFFHFRDPEADRSTIDGHWQNEERKFTRLPVVGDYVARDAASEWYEVKVVIHCPFEADYEAEVYAIKIDRHEVMRKASGEPGTITRGPNPMAGYRG